MTMPRTNGRRARSFEGPPKSQAMSQRPWSQAKSAIPFASWTRFATIGHILRPSRMGRLFSGRRPTDVVRFIVAVVVDAVDRVAQRWARTHVSEKLFERHPRGADRNPSGSIASGLRILTARAHRAPNVVFARIAPVSCVAMSQASRISVALFGAQAAARQRVAASQCTLLDFSFSAAVAPAQPESRMPIFSARFKDQPSAKTLIDFNHCQQFIPRYGTEAA